MPQRMFSTVSIRFQGRSRFQGQKRTRGEPMRTPRTAARVQAKKVSSPQFPVAQLRRQAAPSPDQAAMAEGSPLLALERGEAVNTPPVLYLQGTADGAHPRPLVDRFLAAYRKIGGSVDMHFFEGEKEMFINADPSAPNSVDALAKIVAFAKQQLAA